tara:strand:- start:18966 stop:19982 length:1017 start_codon:yes stop_codon:yes gene_type:complete
VSFKVKINNTNNIEVDAGNTILEVALENNIDFPHGCRSGNCGACKSKLISGNVEMSPYSEFALEDDDKDKGYILACRAVPWSDCEILVTNENNEESNKIIEFEATVKKIKQINEDIYVIKLDDHLTNNFRFYAGQYAELTFGKLPEKHFSMANSPNSKELEFHIKALNNGQTSEYIKNQLKLNDKIQVKGPYGDAFLRTNHKGPIIAIAGGTGLAPILSIVKSAIENNMKQSLKIYYGAKTEKELYFTSEFKKIIEKYKNIEFYTVVNKSRDKYNIRIGNVTDAVIEDIEDFDGYKAYLAGPPKMVEAAEDLLISLSIRKIDIHSDAFYTPYETVKGK